MRKQTEEKVKDNQVLEAGHVKSQKNIRVLGIRDDVCEWTEARIVVPEFTIHRV